MPLTVLITRPQPAAQNFADQLTARLAVDVRMILSPVMQILPVKGALSDMRGVGSIIVTSGNALGSIAADPVAKGLPCLCVGEATTLAAQQLGLNATQGGATAEQLLEHALENPPPRPVLYARGEHVSLDLVGRLREAGISADQVVVYRQSELALTEEALTCMKNGQTIILPLFSVRSARLFFEACPQTENLHVVAISQSVAECVPQTDVKAVSVALNPTAEHMVEMVLDAAAVLNRVEQGY